MSQVSDFWLGSLVTVSSILLILLMVVLGFSVYWYSVLKTYKQINVKKQASKTVIQVELGE